VVIHLAWVTVRAESKMRETDALMEEYVLRLGRYAKVAARAYRDEAALLKAAAGAKAHPLLVLLDSKGKQYSSEGFAEWLGAKRDQGVREMTFAVGPADGWSDAARREAAMMLSLGQMTYPHELARVVVAEQVYRAMTILEGHPYHAGH
jgi:23S rRNA (pseudouridine1915-N3)-methyltransferase